MPKSSPGNCLMGAEGKSASSRLVPGLRKPAHDAHQADHLCQCLRDVPPSRSSLSQSLRLRLCLPLPAWVF